MPRRKRHRTGDSGTTYNRQVICGYVTGPAVKKGYEEVVRRINRIPGLPHTVSVSSVVGRLVERMLPFLMDQEPKTLLMELIKEGEENAKATSVVGRGQGGDGRRAPQPERAGRKAQGASPRGRAAGQA